MKEYYDVHCHIVRNNTTCLYKYVLSYLSTMDAFQLLILELLDIEQENVDGLFYCAFHFK